MMRPVKACAPQRVFSCVLLLFMAAGVNAVAHAQPSAPSGAVSQGDGAAVAASGPSGAASPSVVASAGSGQAASPSSKPDPAAKPDASATAPGASAASAPVKPPSACHDTWPAQRKRPTLTETFPKRGISGHAAFLKIEVEHLPGEYVFPAGLDFGADAPEIEILESASFHLPDRASQVKPSMQRSAEKGMVSTSVSLPVIMLPKEAGRVELTLPRLPVAISRASGQVHTICTLPHVITVEDPLASEPSPLPKGDPEPRAQIEVWTALRDIVLTLLWALPIAFLVAWLLYRTRDKWKKRTPPPPPIPPWELARTRLNDLQARGLLAAHEYEEHLDAVCDVLREYLGGRYGFEGLESTTRELLRCLGQKAPDFSEEQALRAILQRTDLVKFARSLPTEEECLDALRLTRRILDKTTPTASLDPRTSQGGRS